MNEPDNTARTDHLPAVVHQEKLALLLQQSYLAAYISVGVAAILVGVLWQSQDHLRLLIWMGGIVLTAGARLVMYFSFRKRPPEVDEDSSRENLYFAATLAWAYYKADQVQNALRYARRAGRALPNNADVQYHTGMVELALGNATEARTALEQAKTAHSNTAQTSIADIDAALGQL